MDNIENMTEEQLQHKLYDLYQLDWMMYNGASISDMIKGMSDVANERKEDVSSAYNNWFSNSGFNGSVFYSFDEFCKTDYLDVSYMYQLMDTQYVQLGDKLKEIYDECMEDRLSREYETLKKRENLEKTAREQGIPILDNMTEKEIRDYLNESMMATQWAIDEAGWGWIPEKKTAKEKKQVQQESKDMGR